MRCRTAQRRLEAYLGGELAEQERPRLQRHLASCGECGRALERARQLHATLDPKAAPPLPEGFHARLMARARERLERRSWGERILRPFGWEPAMPVRRRVAAAAAVIVSLGIGALIGRDMWRAGSSRNVPPARAATVNPVDLYRADYLAAAPEGSMADAYVSLVSTRARED